MPTSPRTPRGSPPSTPSPAPWPRNDSSPISASTPPRRRSRTSASSGTGSMATPTPPGAPRNPASSASRPGFTTTSAPRVAPSARCRSPRRTREHGFPRAPADQGRGTHADPVVIDAAVLPRWDTLAASPSSTVPRGDSGQDNRAPRSSCPRRPADTPAPIVSIARRRRGFHCSSAPAEDAPRSLSLARRPWSRRQARCRRHLRDDAGRYLLLVLPRLAAVRLALRGKKSGFIARWPRDRLLAITLALRCGAQDLDDFAGRGLTRCAGAHGCQERSSTYGRFL